MTNDSLAQILEMYKNGTLTLDQAKEMLTAAAPHLAGNADTDTSYAGTLPHDGRLRIAVYKGDCLLTKRDYFRGIEFTVNLDGAAVTGDVDCWGNLVCGDIGGQAHAGCNIQCHDIKGGANAGSRIECADISGGVSAGSNIRCGNVTGNLSAGSHVNCGDVSGSITAGGGVRIHK